MITKQKCSKSQAINYAFKQWQEAKNALKLIIEMHETTKDAEEKRHYAESIPLFKNEVDKTETIHYFLTKEEIKPESPSLFKSHNLK